MKDLPRGEELFARLSLIAAAAVVYGLYLGSFSAAAVLSSVSTVAVLAAIVIVGMPFLLYGVQGLLRRRGVPPRVLAGLAGLQVLPFLCLPPRVEVLLPALVVLLQGHLLLRVNDTRFAVGSAVLGPLFVLGEMVLAPARIWLFGFGLCVVLALVAALFLEARRSRRWIDRRLHSGSAWTAVAEARRRPAFPQRAPSRSGATRTIAYGAVVGFLILLLLPFLYLPLLLLPEPVLAVAAANGAPRLEPSDETEPGRTGGQGVRRDAQETFQQIFPGDVSFGGEATTLVRELVMEVTPVPDGPGARPTRRGPLYLRGMVLDTILERGVAFSGRTEPVPLGDADDGRRDGWIELETRRKEAFELDVRQQAIRVRDGSWTVLFGPHPLLGIALPAVRYDPEGLLVDPEGASGWLKYRLRVGQPPLVPTRARRDADGRYLQLPRESPELETLRRLAREIARDATDDRERVARVLAYFHANFEYALKSTEFPGLRGVVDFLSRRSGHCTYYASAAALMLRTLNIPTRIATGFLASDWEEDRYVVTTRNGHAWIEVAFEGAGWIPFDPTPAESRAAALAALSAGAERGIGELMGELYYDFERWVATGDERFLDDFATAAVDLVSALWIGVTRHPWTTGLVVVALLALLGWNARRRRLPAASSRLRRRQGPEADLYGRLLRALERHGHAKATAQTPREFAHAVVACEAALFADVVPWTERFYRARFGDEPLAQDEREALRRYVARLASAPALRRDRAR